MAGKLSSALYALFPPLLNSRRRPFPPSFAFFFGSKRSHFFLFSPHNKLTTIGVLTREFLDFSASRGNNLRTIGLEPGCKWCLCTARWKEAADARKGDDDPVVPK